MSYQYLSILIPRWFLALSGFYLTANLYAGFIDFNDYGISNRVKIEYANGLYSVTAQQASLSDVLFQLSEVAKIKIKNIDYQSHEKNDYLFDSLPLEQLLENLLWNYSTILIYEDEISEKNVAKSHRVKELWLIDKENTTDHEQQSYSYIQRRFDPLTDAGHLTAVQKRELEYIDKLKGLTSHDVIDILKETLLIEKDPVIRQRVVQALADIGGVRVLDALESALGDTSAEVRAELVKSFSQIQHPRSMLALGQMLIGDNDVKVRIEAVRGLYRLKSLPARALVESALKDKNKSVILIANEVLAHWESSSI